eukprot:88218_1
MAEDLEEPSLQDLDSMDNTPEFKEIPAIRDDPEMARTTSKRRSSVAHPQSLQYTNPTLSDHSSHTSDEEHDEDDSIADLHRYDNINRKYGHTEADPSISDLNEILSQTPSQTHTQHSHEDSVDDEEDPFARLGMKQQSVALPPVIQSIDAQQRMQQQLMQPQNNPYLPEAILEPKHLQHRHSSKHSHTRSQTLASQHRQNLDELPMRVRAKQRRNHSSSVDWSDNMQGPPSGGDLTFLCMKVENRTILQDALSDDRYLELMSIHNTIFEQALKRFNGHCIEQHNGHVYDALTVFNDVYDAMRCSLNIQKELNHYKWPVFYYELERSSPRMSYVGTGDQGAFNGLRVGMALHTASVDREINKYDGGKETLHVTTVIFDATYKGTSVDLVKALCIKSFGGELLATKALYQALLRSKKGGDQISVQKLGMCKLDGLRNIELIQMAPRDLPHRQFPPHSFISNARKTLQLQMLQESETPSYDPFPMADEDEEEEETSEYDTVEMNDVAHDSHSSGNDEVQHQPPRRRPSITQFVAGPDSTIEVSFNGPDEDNDPGYDIKYNDTHLDVKRQGSMDSEHSIDPPRQQSSRSKALEMEKRRSMKHDDEVTNMLIKEVSPRGIQPIVPPKKKGKKVKKLKRKKSGQLADDESTPVPGDSDSIYYVDKNAIAKPKRKPRANKKAEHFGTMVGINFDPDDSSVYSAGSRSLRTSCTGKSRSILNPERQMKLYKSRPPNLPNAYSEDKEFTCLCCQENKLWTTGVWRVPMWPSFDVCVACGNKELQTGTSKRAIDNFNPNAGALGILYPQQVDNNMKHRKVPSNQPLMREFVDDLATTETKMSRESLEILRKELSSIIEVLTNEKLQRLENLGNWAQNDTYFEEFRTKTKAEHKATEEEINSWRKKANRLDEQEQRVMRRKNTVNMESPNASDLESDEELHHNWQDYDYNEDFATIHSRLKELDQLFWTEDQFFRKRMENQNKANQVKIEQLQSQYAQTTHQLQQRNDELSSKINGLISDTVDVNTVGHKYDNILNNGDDIDEYSSDDLENANMERYGAYVPPSVKHIHKHSQILNAAELAKHLNTGDVEDQKKLVLLQNTITGLTTQIDNYISTVNRKDRLIRDQEKSLEELNQKVNYLENLNDTDEQFAQLHTELEATKEENFELQNKLKIYLYDEPPPPAASQHILSENEDSFSNMLFDDFTAEQKDAIAEEEEDMTQDKENEIRLKVARSKMEGMEENISELTEENDRLTQSKQELVNQTSQQIENMRDELQNMCAQLQDKENMIRRLIHVNKEGYDPEHDQKSDTNARLSLTNPLGISNSIAGLWTYGRSKFSSSHTIKQTTKSKIDLAIATSSEIQRLREIIKALTTANGTTYGGTNAPWKSSNSLIGASNPGS